MGVVSCDWLGLCGGVTNSLIGGAVWCVRAREKRGPMPALCTEFGERGEEQRRRRGEKASDEGKRDVIAAPSEI